MAPLPGASKSPLRSAGRTRRCPGRQSAGTSRKAAAPCPASGVRGPRIAPPDCGVTPLPTPPLHFKRPVPLFAPLATPAAIGPRGDGSSSGGRSRPGPDSVPLAATPPPAPSSAAPGPAWDRARVGSPPEPRRPAPRETHPRRQPPLRPPRQLLQSEPPPSPPGATQRIGRLPERASRAFGLRSALRNRTSCRLRSQPAHATRVAGAPSHARSSLLRSPGHSCCSLAAAQNAAVPSSAALLGSASVPFLRAPGLGNGGEPASAQPAPLPVQKNPAAPRASTLRGFKKPLSTDPPGIHARNPRPSQAASGAPDDPLRGKPYPGQRPARIPNPCPPSTSDGHQPTHHHQPPARLASPRPGDPRTDPGARHGPRHLRPVARPLRRIQRRVPRTERLRPIPLARSGAARGIAEGLSGRTKCDRVTITVAGEAGADRRQTAQDLGDVAINLESLDHLRPRAELPDQGRAGGTPALGRGEIGERSAAWRVGFPLVKGNEALVPRTTLPPRARVTSASPRDYP